MTVVAARPLTLLAALALALACVSCNDESSGSTGGGTTTPSGRSIDARPLEGGCPDDDPVATLDLNRDGNPDFVEIPEDGGTCRAADMNFDGAWDLFRHRDEAGNLLREEADGDHDLRLDAVALYQGSREAYREEFDSNWDGHVDLWVDLRRDCAFSVSPPNTCTSNCAVPWCQPRYPTTDEAGGPPPEPGGPPASITVLYRDSNGDGIWDTAEVLFGEFPICTAFNTNATGDSSDEARPEVIEMYRPNSARYGRPDIDYLRRDYLDLEGNPIVRCEDSDGAVIPCPSACTG